MATLDLFARTGACDFLRTAPGVLLVLPGESFRLDGEVSVLVLGTPRALCFGKWMSSMMASAIISQVSGMGEEEDRPIIIAWGCTPFGQLIYTSTNTRNMLH